MELNWDKELQPATNLDRLLIVSTSTNSTTKTAPHPKIKSFGRGLHDFANEDGTFAQWLMENPYSDDEVSSPMVWIMKALRILEPCANTIRN